MYGQRTCNDAELRSRLRAAEDELASHRANEDARREREIQERHARIRERMDEREANFRQASTWPEALSKQATLLGQNVYLEDGSEPTEDYFFTGGKEACKRALELWKEEEPKVAEQIVELERQIAALRDGIATTVGQRLEAENEKNNRGWASIAAALQEMHEDEDVFSDWLNW